MTNLIRAVHSIRGPISYHWLNTAELCGFEENQTEFSKLEKI